MLLIGTIQLYYSGKHVMERPAQKSIVIQVSFLSELGLDYCQYAQMGMIAATMAIISSSVISLQAKQGLPRLNQIAAWTILSVSCHSSTAFISC